MSSPHTRARAPAGNTICCFSFGRTAGRAAQLHYNQTRIEARNKLLQIWELSKFMLMKTSLSLWCFLLPCWLTTLTFALRISLRYYFVIPSPIYGTMGLCVDGSLCIWLMNTSALEVTTPAEVNSTLTGWTNLHNCWMPPATATVYHHLQFAGGK